MILKRLMPALLGILSSMCSINATPLEPVLLWPKGAPDALGNKDHDKPTLTAFLPAPDKATGAAMVICPGGAYLMLAGHEGADYAVWLAQHGIAGIVLKYRLGVDGYRHPTMLHDAARAVRLTRAKASEWKIDPKRVGIIGTSAGGHLAATLLTHFDAGNPDAADPVDRLSSRPDVGVLCYPVITMGPNTNALSRQHLLGDHPAPELIDELSNEKQVTKNTPPCFIWHNRSDDKVKVDNAIDFALALHKADVPFDLHVYQNGGHGMGLGDPHPWTVDLLFWLKEQGYAK